MEAGSSTEERREEGVALQKDIMSKMEAELAPQESDEEERAAFTQGESFESVESDDSSVLPPPPPSDEEKVKEDDKEDDKEEDKVKEDDKEEDKDEDFSFSNYPRDDDTYGFSLQDSVPPASVQSTDESSEPAPVSGGASALPTAEPSRGPSPVLVVEADITVAGLAPLSPRQGSSNASNKSNTSNPKFKTKIDDRLTYALSLVDFSEQRRSPDLVPLARNYQGFRKQLRNLIASIKAYKKTTEQMEEARSKLWKHYYVMSEETPLYDHIGKSSVALPNKGGSVEPVSAQQEEKEMGGLSLASIHELALANEKKASEEYEQFILAYAREWEEVVTTRLDQGIKGVQQLQRKKVHYERKVGGLLGLRKRVDGLEKKGKEVPNQLAEKLQRNEQKLLDAFNEYELRASEVCVLLEEATEKGWKDLYPLVKNSIRFEINRISRDEDVCDRLKTTLSWMKKKSFSPTTSPAPSVH